MEARSAYKGAAVSKTFVAAVLVIVAIGLGIMGAYFVASLGGSKAAVPGVTIQAPARGTNLSPDAADRYAQLNNSKFNDSLQTQFPSVTTSHHAPVLPMRVS